MKKSKDRLLIESLGKIISIFYNDTYNSVSFKTGKFLDFDNYIVKILENQNQNPTMIPRSKCIRIEMQKQEKIKAKI